MSANAITAYEAGASGEGVSIAVIDTGINPSLPAFAGRVSAASADAAGNRGVSDDDGHGTAVSSVAAGARDGSNTMGVAYEATIISYRADDPGSCATSDGCALFDDDIADGVDAAVAAGATVINLSLGGGDPSRRLQNSINAAAAAGVVIVIAAGNDGRGANGDNPDTFASIPAFDNPGMVIIAGALGDSTPFGVDDDRIAEFSNRAGTAGEYYLAALGADIQAPDHTGTQFLWSGTSFSAPVISGAVALLADAFPNLTGAEIVEILFTSADDLGDPGTDAIYGRGRLNLDSAFQPIGATSLAGTDESISLSFNGALPMAAGDAGASAGQTTLVTDRYDRAYNLEVGKTLSGAQDARPLGRALAGQTRSGGVAMPGLNLALTVAPRFGMDAASPNVDVALLGLDEDGRADARLLAGRIIAAVDDKTAVALGFSEGASAMQRQLARHDSARFFAARTTDLGFDGASDGALAVRRDLGFAGLTLAADTGDVATPLSAFDERSATYRRFLVALDRDLGSFGRASLSFTRLDESETLLGGRIDPVLGGGGGALTHFIDAEWRRDLGAGVDLGLTGRLGSTDFAAGNLVTSAFAIDLGRRHNLAFGDRLGFRVAQPLRVEAGGIDLYGAVAWDYATESATFGWQRFSLSPSGREMVGEASYSSPLGRGRVGANIFYRHQPGHIATAPADIGGAVSYSIGL
ncbi:S8 family peptidase [Sphingomicrobium sediminis]|uniref:S8 family serine peptidase n=1 Tax=Sphingomicrobium sediminis TaxID=2950949 RepID=A0A9X2EMA4_9SPHN|nr:S8 family serine peptidase [Sphingomicrobium sediminis]